MTNVLSSVAKQKFFDNNGKPAVGYKLFTYAAGTSTKLATYQDGGTGSPNTNPIVLDFRGECDLWVPPNVAYKYVFAPPNDTDPPTHPIWSVDDIVDSQLVTLWGGVDTGIANAYVLNFVANFTAYTDGIVIYWIPSNTNTGASTINVNGLGPVAITNQDGSPLYLGQLQANQVALIIYKGTGFVLVAFGLLPTINTQNTSYTLQITDANNILLRTSGSLPIDWTIPANATVAFPIGTSVEFINAVSAGLINILAAGGVTLVPFSGTNPINQIAQSSATAYRKTAINTWQQITLSNFGHLTGSFTGTLTGMTGSVTGQIDYYLITPGNVYLSRSGAAPALTGTSNAGTMTLTGIPADLRPKFTSLVPCYGVIDNGSLALGSYVSVSSAGVATFVLAANPPAVFTAAGTKGLSSGWKLSYSTYF